MSDTTEPTFDVTHRPCLFLDLPELSDEAAWQLSEFLQTLAEHIDTHYSAQISRAYRAHQSEREQLHRERVLVEAQHPLPFGDPPF
jgi:FKBP-type peptidyl-prolyl cis-trans isomerase (trigger factor)